MKRLSLFFLLLSALALQMHSVTIREVNMTGNDQTDPAAILHFFYEYDVVRNWAPEELNAVLQRFSERLERTGWFRDVEVRESVSNEQAIVRVSLKEKIPYSVTAGNLYLGLSKYNLWGKGKTVRFEIGPIRQKIVLEDRMFYFSRFFYSITLGKEENYYFSYETNTIVQNLLLRKTVQIALGLTLLPDLDLSLINNNFWLDYTNNVKLDKQYRVGLKLDYDKRAGYPSVEKGYFLSWQGHYIIPQNVLQTEVFAQFYLPLFKDLILAAKGHLGALSSPMPEYFQFNLRDIDGLRTLSSFSGLTGNDCWDIHTEARWSFWDIIPFFIFDMRLEALAFLDTGEARPSFSDFGKPHFVYGAGLRVYIDTLAIRVEAGIDEAGETSILTGFNLPF